jgi:hypothetical protein
MAVVLRTDRKVILGPRVRCNEPLGVCTTAFAATRDRYSQITVADAAT